MGGSLGLAIKRAKLARLVTGLARRPATLRQAKRLGCLDQGTLDPRQAAGADLVVLAGPVSSMPGLLASLAPHLPAGCLVTDVGSTKTWLCSQVKALLKRQGLVFIGSHPMAGSEKAGVSASRADLYDQSLCLLVPPAAGAVPAARLGRLRAFWRAVGCGRVLTVSPAVHDRLTAAASHVPHVAAVSLVNALAEEAGRDPRVLDVAASGFRDTTRIAASLPGMWADILLTNRTEVGVRLQRLAGRLLRFRRLLIAGQRPAVLKELERARAARLDLEPRHGKR